MRVLFPAQPVLDMCVSIKENVPHISHSIYIGLDTEGLYLTVALEKPMGPKDFFPLSTWIFYFLSIFWSRYVNPVKVRPVTPVQINHSPFFRQSVSVSYLAFKYKEARDQGERFFIRNFYVEINPSVSENNQSFAYAGWELG